MMRLIIIIMILGIVWTGSACQSVDLSVGYYASPLHEGEEITFLHAVEIPSGYARAYLQGGRVMGYAAVDQYAPFCYILMRQPLPVAQTVHPGVFVIDKVYLLETDVGRELPTRIAARGVLAHDDGYGPIAFQTHMKFLRGEQPDVDSLVCSGAFAIPGEARPIRRVELQQVLGDIASVRAPVPADR